MRRSAHGDVLKVWLYAAAVIALGAWSAPFFYNTGRALEEVTAGKRTNGVLNALGEFARAAEFPGFFVVAIAAAALVLLFPLMEWLGLKRITRGWGSGQPLRRTRLGVLEGLIGFLLSICLFGVIGYGLVMTGNFVGRVGLEGSMKFFPAVLPWILLAALVQEWLLRGVILGIFLRAMRPGAAIGLAALLFTVMHLLNPPDGVNVVDPDAGGGGFRLLGILVARLSRPEVLVREVLPLLAMGWVLGYARWRTASVWLPAGLYAGWVFASNCLAEFAWPVRRADPLAGLLAGDSLMHGLIPFAGVLMAGGLVYFLTGRGEAAADVGI